MINVHERIAAAVAEARAGAENPVLGPAEQLMEDHFPEVNRRIERFMLAACDHADKVLARHPACDGIDAPVCPEVGDLADLWLGEGWENDVEVPRLGEPRFTRYVPGEPREDE